MHSNTQHKCACTHIQALQTKYVNVILIVFLKRQVPESKDGWSVSAAQFKGRFMKPQWVPDNAVLHGDTHSQFVVIYWLKWNKRKRLWVVYLHLCLCFSRFHRLGFRRHCCNGYRGMTYGLQSLCNVPRVPLFSIMIFYLRWLYHMVSPWGTLRCS